jgi:N utilization substance protein B
MTVRAGTHARRRALEVLHAADAAAVPVVLDGEPGDVRAIVEGVEANREEIDAVIRRTAEHWAIERMPVVDRNLLRMGIYELLHTGAKPRDVVNDAVDLAKLLSTEESGRFVNGVLGRIAREHRARP